MAKSASSRSLRNGIFSAKGVEASRLRRRKFALVRRYGIPEELLGGSLTETLRRCGKPGCHCASDAGHPMWTLTYSVEGKKHVLVIPAAAVPLLKPLVESGREYRDAVAELLAINAQLLSLWRATTTAREGKAALTGCVIDSRRLE